MDTFVFSLTLDGRTAGIAVLAPAVRFCAVRWRGAVRPDRRLLHAASWQGVLAVVEAGIAPGELEASALTRALAGNSGAAVTLQAVKSLPDDVPERVPALLDAMLDPA